MYNYIVEDSFNTRQLIKDIEKAVPEIITQLNSHLFGDKLESAELCSGTVIHDGPSDWDMYA